MSEYIFR